MHQLIRRHDERGASAVVIALLMTALLAAAGLGIDTSSAAYERSRVQNSADNAALAIARDCAVAKVTCSSAGASSTASYFATQNSGGGTVSVPGTVAPSAGSVQVKVSKSVAMSFGSALGIAPKTLSGTAKASWNTVPVEGLPVFPLALSWCDYKANLPGSGKPPKLFRSDATALAGAGQTSCVGPNGSTVKSTSGAIWFTSLLGLGDCRFRTNIGARIGAVLSSILYPIFCTDEINAIDPNKTYLLPLYTDETWIPAAKQLTARIEGFAAVKVTGWKFGLLILGTTRNNPCPFLSLTCQGIEVTFERTAQKNPDFEYGVGPNFGAVDVKLTN